MASELTGAVSTSPTGPAGDPFVGRAALEAQRAAGLRRKLVCLVLDDAKAGPLHGLETIWRGDDCIGFVKSTAFGHTLGKTIAYGYVDVSKVGGDAADAPEKITVKWLKAGEWSVGDKGARHAATFHSKAPFDPTNARVRGEY